jgi:hypothetical protein
VKFTGVRIEIDNVAALKKAVAGLTKDKVLVGIPEAKDERDETGIGNAALAYIHNFGAPEANIPAREFMYSGMSRAREQIVKRFRDGAIAALEGAEDRVAKNLNAAGLEATSAIKSRITEGIPPPLADATLAARERAGFAGTKPLVRTAQMRNALTYVVRKIG